MLQEFERDGYMTSATEVVSGGLFTENPGPRSKSRYIRVETMFPISASLLNKYMGIGASTQEWAV